MITQNKANSECNSEFVLFLIEICISTKLVFLKPELNSDKFF